jgi:chemotaxis protein CheC
VNLTGHQLDFIQRALHQGAAHASDALGRWIRKPTHIAFDRFESLPLEAAMGVLGAPDEPICFCRAEMTGHLRGHLILAFDDASGLALTDLLFGHPRGTATEWGEMEQSAALETTNIISCAYMNAVHRVLPAGAGGSSELIPSPPHFARDFAESLIQFALMDQIVTSDTVLLARTEFRIDETPVDWTLLFVPDAGSLERLDADAT